MYENNITIAQMRMLQRMNEYCISGKEDIHQLDCMEKASQKWMLERERIAAVDSKFGVKYIRCPHSIEEREKIMEWIDQHQYDAKSLAVALWLSGGIAPQEIINLRKEDYRYLKNMDTTMVCEKRSFQKWNTIEIMWKALKLHPKELEFVFMSQKGADWKKLKGTSIQMKMYHICDEIGITYKPFHKNEAIQYDV